MPQTAENLWKSWGPFTLAVVGMVLIGVVLHALVGVTRDHYATQSPIALEDGGAILVQVAYDVDGNTVERDLELRRVDDRGEPRWSEAFSDVDLVAPTASNPGVLLAASSGLGEERQLIGVSVADGEVLWRRPRGELWPYRALDVDGALWLDGGLDVTRLDAATGAPAWSGRAPSGGVIAFDTDGFSREGRLSAVPEAGELESVPSTGAPCVVGDTLWTASRHTERELLDREEPAYYFVLHPRDGTPTRVAVPQPGAQWRFPPFLDLSGALCGRADGVDVITVRIQLQTQVWALDPTTHQLRGGFELPGRLVATPRHLTRLSETGRLPRFPVVLAQVNDAYWLVTLDLKEGRVFWRVPLTVPVPSSEPPLLVTVGDHQLATDNEGKLLIVVDNRTGGLVAARRAWPGAFTSAAQASLARVWLRGPDETLAAIAYSLPALEPVVPGTRALTDVTAAHQQAMEWPAPQEQ